MTTDRSQRLGNSSRKGTRAPGSIPLQSTARHSFLVEALDAMPPLAEQVEHVRAERAAHEVREFRSGRIRGDGQRTRIQVEHAREHGVRRLGGVLGQPLEAQARRSTSREVQAGLMR